MPYSVLKRSKMGCCCSSSKRAKRERAATSSSELTSSLGSLPSSQKTGAPNFKKLDVQTENPKPTNGYSPSQLEATKTEPELLIHKEPADAAPPAATSEDCAQSLLRCPSVVLFEDDAFFDAQEEVQWEASHEPHSSPELGIIFNRYENWMVSPPESCPKCTAIKARFIGSACSNDPTEVNGRRKPHVGKPGRRSQDDLSI